MYTMILKVWTAANIICIVAEILQNGKMPETLAHEDKMLAAWYFPQDEKQEAQRIAFIYYILH